MRAALHEFERPEQRRRRQAAQRRERAHRPIAILRLEPGEDSSVKFGVSDNQLFFEAGDRRLMARMIDVNFPNYMEVISRDNDRHVMVDRERLLSTIRRISLVDEFGQRRVRMAHLAIVASQKVNGVSKLHSQLMVQNIFSDFARMYPDRFTNVTNGITPRRWLAQASPSLSSLIDKRIGPRWRTDLFELGRLREWRDDPEFRKAFHDAKFANKLRLVERARREANAIINPEALFDLQVKRIHEYKRQLLNILYVIVRYNRIRENPERDWTPRVVMFAAASRRMRLGVSSMWT